MTASSSPGEVGGKPLHGWSCACGDAGPGDHAETPDPAGPQCTWTDEAREDLQSALQRWWDEGGEPGEDDEDGEWVVLPGRVLDALAPHVARQVANLTAERDEARRKVAAVKALCDEAETPPGCVSPEWRQAVLEGDASPMLLVRDIRRVLGTAPPTEGAVE